MNQEEIMAVDPSFDFSKAYKRNYCTLLNITIEKAEVKKCFAVDGVAVESAYRGDLHFVSRREFLNRKSFPLENSSEKLPQYWSSVEKAWTYFEKIKNGQGLELLDKEKAFEVARLFLEK